MAPLVVVLLVSAAPGAAQTGDSLRSLRAALAATRPASLVRVELRDQRRISGTLGPVGAEAVQLHESSGAAASVPLAEVTRLWRRGRATRTGAIVGGVLGAGFGLFLGALASGLCEYDCPSSTESAMAQGAVGFGLLGTVPGAIIGAAIPKWRTAWRGGIGPRAPAPGAPVTIRRTTADTAAAPVPSRRVGEFTRLVTAGYASARATPGRSGSAGPGAGITLGLGMRRGRLAFGPETGVHLGLGGRAWSFNGMGRIDVAGSNGGRTSYLVLGAGANVWLGREAIFTGVIGVGQTRRGRWRIEARWHPILQYEDAYRSDPTYLTVGFGRVVGW